MHKFIRSGYRIENYETVEKDHYGNIRGFLNNLTGTISDGKFVRLWGVQRDITDHKKADQQLVESEKRYRSLIEAITDYIYTVRIDNGRAVETIHGPGCEAITGYTTLDFSRDPDLWLRMVVEEDRHAVIGQAEKILSGGEVQAIEHRIIRKDGQVRWVRNTTVLRYDGEGRLVTCDGLIQDITGHKRAEEALQESEERYSALFSNNYSVSLIIDPDNGRIVNANDAAARYYGYSRDQLLALGIHDLNRLPPDKVVRNLRRAKDEKEKHFFSTHYSADGEKRYVEIYSGPITVQGKPLFYSIIHDVTDSRLAELALKESEERYRTLVDQLPDYVLVHRNGILLYVNPAAASNLGYDAEKLIGNPVFPLIAPEYHETVRQAIIRRMAGEIIPSYEMKIRAGDGTFRTVLTNGAAITFEGKRASLNVLTDISTLKEAEETIRSANEKLEKRVAERTEALSNANEQLTAGIAARTRAEQEITRSLEEKDLLLREIHHRVKNNLQIIASLLNLQSRYITDPNVLESIKDSQSRVRAMALVHERIYRSHNISEINIKEYLTYLTKQILQFYNIPQHQIGITVTMDDIITDIDTVIPVGLILNELVSNSLKHAFPDGRKGTISIEGIPQDAKTLRFVYHDNGVGMPAGFDWKNTESLGLRLVNSLVDQLDGTIESSGGEGTTFIITIRQKRDPGPS
jgi:PAS domain S-box-containing protein